MKQRAGLTPDLCWHPLPPTVSGTGQGSSELADRLIAGKNE